MGKRTVKYLFNKIKKIFQNILSFKYLKIAVLNTFFSYLITFTIFSFFYEKLGIFILLIFSTILSIGFTFLTYKFFYFKTKKIYFFDEIKRMYLVYLSTFFFSYYVIHYLLEKLEMNLYLVIVITQCLTTLINIFSQFIYIFKKND